MNRRYFAKLGALSLGSFLLNQNGLNAQNINLDVGERSGEIKWDNDEAPFEFNSGARQDFSTSSIFKTSFAGDLLYLPFEKVINNLSPYLESKFDVFFFANTATKSLPENLVPHQHMLLVKKRVLSESIFVRDTQGGIIDFSDNADIELVTVSSGRGGSNCLFTYSGIFRVNHNVTRARIGTNESVEAHMSWSTYIDFVYSSGREARVAIHGTPSRNHFLLGKNRASEGCLRVLPVKAKEIRDFLLSADMWSEDLPKFNSKMQLPGKDVQDGNIESRAGIKALVITFDGFSS